MKHREPNKEEASHVSYTWSTYKTGVSIGLMKTLAVTLEHAPCLSFFSFLFVMLYLPTK